MAGGDPLGPGPLWYLGIAGHGYVPIRGVGLARAAFFPLYPLLVWVVSGFGATAGARLVAAFVVSLAAFIGALYLLHRLTALELGEQYALPCLVLIALFPGALFFGIPYSEAVFLLVSVGAFYAARTGHWAWAGLLAALASATRSAGVLLLAPLLLLYLYGPRRDRPVPPPEREKVPRRLPSRLAPRFTPGAEALWLALAPLGLVAYSAYLQVAHHDALAWSRVEADWMRRFSGPLGALVTGARQAWRGLYALISGTTHSVYLQHGYLEPTRAAAVDIALFVFALAALVALVGTFRRLPLAYGVWALVALVLPLSYPAAGQALESLPRFLAVLFPLFMWLAGWSYDRRAVEPVAGTFALLLGVVAAQFAAWEFIS